MRIRDWRYVEPTAIGALYAAERERWIADLGWDTGDAWSEIEGARAAGRLPGLVAVDAQGAVRGWTYFLIDDRIAQVGSLVCESADATRALLDSVLARAQGQAETVTCFSYTRAPGLERELARQGFATTRYQYLSRQAAASVTPGAVFGDRWGSDDVAPAAELLRAAYGSNGRYFAPHGLPQEWQRYVRNLVEYPGCGRFDPAATCVAREAGRLTGLVMTTELSAGVAHVAQVAVHPDARGRGLAGRLLDQALALAAAHGRPRVTLLVEEGAAAARTLYAHRGFAPCATFVAARRPLKEARRAS
jgi:ribosomal protein S18 acetylase RimI-like enzyme